MNGTQTYLKKLTVKKNRIATSVLLASIVLSLYFSLIKSSYFFSLLFCFIEVIFSNIMIIVKRSSVVLLQHIPIWLEHNEVSGDRSKIDSASIVIEMKNIN